MRTRESSARLPLRRSCASILIRELLKLVMISAMPLSTVSFSSYLKVAKMRRLCRMAIIMITNGQDQRGHWRLRLGWPPYRPKTSGLWDAGTDAHEQAERGFAFRSGSWHSAAGVRSACGTHREPSRSRRSLQYLLGSIRTRRHDARTSGRKFTPALSMRGRGRSPANRPHQHHESEPGFAADLFPRKGPGRTSTR